MANSKQAKKRARQAEDNRKHNSSRRSESRTCMKKLVKLIASNDHQAAMQEYVIMTSLLDRLANKGIIHPNKASRHKSRFISQIKKLQADTVELQADTVAS